MKLPIVAHSIHLAQFNIPLLELLKWMQFGTFLEHFARGQPGALGSNSNRL
jgi:hypothetical protein